MDGRDQRLPGEAARRAGRRGSLPAAAIVAACLAIATVTVSAQTLPSPSPVPRTTAPVRAAPKLLSPTPGSLEFTLASGAMTVTNLTFTGTATITSGTATLTVLHFTADSVSLAGFTQQQPCLSTPPSPTTWRVVETVPAGATAVLSGPVHLAATSLSYTPPSLPAVTYDAGNLPALGVLLAAGTLPAVQITATSLTAATLTAPQLSASIATC